MQFGQYLVFQSVFLFLNIYLFMLMNTYFFTKYIVMQIDSLEANRCIIYTVMYVCFIYCMEKYFYLRKTGKHVIIPGVCKDFEGKTDLTSSVQSFFFFLEGNITNY